MNQSNKNLKIFSLLYFLLFSYFIVAQEIDPLEIENLSPEEILDAKNMFDDIAASRNTIADEEGRILVPESIIQKEIDNDKEVVEPGSKKFGYDFISTAPTSITAFGDLPLPNDYKISLRDQFTVILSGSKESIFDLDVKLDGTILFPEIGSISVVNESFIDVKTKIKNLIDQSYVGVQVDLSIKELAAKKITIVGAVENPGTYLVNPFSTISNALGYSGGILEIGSLRNIKLRRTSGEELDFDLYDLLINGDRSDDVTVEAGDVILVEAASRFVKITGQVRRPAIYELEDDERLSDLVRFALGFTEIANKNSISLEILDIDSSEIKSVKSNDLSKSIDNIISVEVNKFVTKGTSSIRVAGAVKEPGLYDLTTFGNLNELINNIEFVNVYPWLAVLESFDENNLIKSIDLFSLKDPDTYDSIELSENSVLYFADLFERSFEDESLSDLAQRSIEDYTTNLLYKGQTFFLPAFGEIKLSELINYLGLDMSDVERDATYISPIDGIVITGDYEELTFTSNKYQTINLRAQVNDIIQVSISGAIEFPGTYSLNSGSTLDDLYNLVGDFRSEAFLDGIVFKRESVKEQQKVAIEKSTNELNQLLISKSIQDEKPIDIAFFNQLASSINEENLGRVSGDFNPNSSIALNKVLFDGDEIIIPKNPNTINVLGEVQSQLTFEFSDNISIREAIVLAGGYKAYADKSRIYVIKANGLIQRQSRNVFSGNGRLEPGDTVVIPRKMLTNNPITQALIPVTTILSDLAFSAAAIESLSNN